MESRRCARIVAIAAALMAISGCSSGGGGEAYPDNSIDYIIPFAPGGTTDPLGREYSRMLEEELGTSVVVQNVPGGDTTIGVSTLVGSEPDGYTLGLSSTAGIMIQPIVNPDLDYGVDDFKVLNKMAEGPNAIFVGKSSPYKTLDDLLAAAKAKPGEVSIATTGRLISTSFVVVSLEQQAGVEFNLVPYDGGGEASLAAMSGEVDAVVVTASGQLGMVESGDLRALAYTGTSEGFSKHLPDAVALQDAGYDIPFPADYVTIAPAGLPDDVLNTIAEASQKVFDSPEWASWIEEQALVPTVLTGNELQGWYDSTFAATENAVKLLEERLA